MALPSATTRASACTRSSCVARAPGLYTKSGILCNSRLVAGSSRIAIARHGPSPRPRGVCKVVAFLEDKPSSQIAQARTNCQLTVHTMDGRYYTFPFSAGTTTAGDIRAAVADRTNTPVGQVRLAYAGRELNPLQDSQPFTVKPGIHILHAMQRMSGGGSVTITAAEVDNTAAATEATAPAWHCKDLAKANAVGRA